MNKKKIGLCLLIIIWFACSTKIITGFYNRNVEIGKSVDISYLNMPIGYSSVDEIYCTSNIFSSMGISGWFVYPNATGEAKTYLYLESSKGSYKIGTQLSQLRSDILAVVKRWGISVDGSLYNFSVAFCPFFLKDGEYKLYILAQDGNKIVGMSRTNYVINKDRKGISIEEEESHQVDSIVSAGTTDIQRWIDSLAVEDDTLQITGWLLFPGVTNTQRESYIGIVTADGTEKFYQAVTFARLDLLGMTREFNCKEAGFEVDIPLEDIGDIKSSQLNFYVKSDGEFYRAADGWEFTVQ